MIYPDCSQRVDGRCTVAESLVQLHAGAPVEVPCKHPRGCEVCLAEGGPGPTRTVVSWAMAAAPTHQEAIRQAVGSVLKPAGPKTSEATVKKKAEVPHAAKLPGVGDVLESILHERHGAVAAEGCDCRGTIARMNDLGPDGCEAEQESLLDELASNGASSGRWLHRMASNWAPRTFRRKARRCLLDAIDWSRNPPGQLAVIAPLFNPSGHRVFEDNWRIWRASMQPLLDTGRIHSLTTIQAVWPGQQRLGDTVIDATDRQICWQKERMINLAVEQLPPEVDLVAWVDTDLLFQNPHWPEDVRLALTVHNVVQCYSDIARTGEARGEPQLSVCAVRGRTGTAPGGALAARRSVLQAMGGLYDGMPYGEADHWNLFAWTRTVPIERGETPFLRHWQRWADHAHAVVGERVAAVPGTLLHLYHGSRANRGYGERRHWITDFDPERDLRIAGNGLFEWTRDDMLELARAHFLRRVEGLPAAA